MATVMVRIHVDAQGQISGRAPATVPPGDYAAPVPVPQTGSRRHLVDLPLDDEPWDDRISLRREDLYDDAGR